MAETLRELVVALSLDSSNFSRNMRTINKQIQEAESAFRLASAGVENFETTTAGLSSKLSTLQRTFQLQQLKTEVASAAQAYRHYKNTLGETDSATIAAKANLDACKGEYRAAGQEVKKLEGQNVALKKSTQNAADAFSAAQTKLNGAKGAVKETAAEIDQCNRQLALTRTGWASAGEAIQASQRSITSIGKQMKTAESSYRLAAAGVKDFDKSAAGLTAKLTLLQEKMGLQQKAVAEYEKALAASKEQLQAAQQVNDPDKIREATDAVQDAESALNNARAAVKQTRADIAGCNKELKTAQSEWTKAGKSLESFGKSCDSISKNLNKAGKLLSTTLTTPIVALGTAAIKSSIDFESSFASVRKTVDATEAEFDQLAATSKKMSTQVAAGTDEINEVMAAGGQLGVATEHLSDFTRVMIDLGNSCEDLNAGDAATTIAQFANIMGTSQSQFSNIGSIGELAAQIATIALAQLTTANINNAEIDWASIGQLQADIAKLVNANIQTADIDWAQIKDLTAGTAIIEKGVNGKLYVADLAVTEANMARLTVGELIVKGADGCFYALSIAEDGTVTTEKKSIGDADIGDNSISGGKLIEKTITARELNVASIFADEALVGAITAANIDVSSLFAAEAFIAQLNAVDISGNESLRLVVDAAKDEALDATGEAVAQIALTAEQIRSEVKRDYATNDQMSQVTETLSTLAEQSENNFTWTVTKVNEIIEDAAANDSLTREQLNLIHTYMRFGEDGLTIGKAGNPLTFRVVNDRLAFYMNDTEVAYLSDNKLYVTQAEILARLQIGKFAYEPQSNGNLSVIYTG